ncbi:MAG: chemotaxis protein CheW [Gammaproteobacteria bacterium]|nr:chemotaxis protein CheW [Gammaproteobacteria bacterium]
MTIISLAQALQLSASQHRVTAASRLVISHRQGDVVAYLVDEVRDLVTISSDEITVGEGADVAQTELAGVSHRSIEIDRRQVILLDQQRLLERVIAGEA